MFGGGARPLIVASGISLYFFIPLAAEFTLAVPDHMRGQCVGLLTMSMRVTQGIAILGFGVLAQNASSGLVIAGAGVVGVCIAIVLSVAWGATRDPTPHHGAPAGGA